MEEISKNNSSIKEVAQMQCPTYLLESIESLYGMKLPPETTFEKALTIKVFIKAIETGDGRVLDSVTDELKERKKDSKAKTKVILKPLKITNDDKQEILNKIKVVEK